MQHGGRSVLFPGCDRPPGWTQAHHFQEYTARQGPTSVDNCGLVCGYHHREFGKRGWRAEMIDGRPHWIPPAWIDPHQKPRLNTIHYPPNPARQPTQNGAAMASSEEFSLTTVTPRTSS
jgi:hypothetical protein